MKGLIEVVNACREAGARGESGVLATVVKVQGSAYRRPGARMFFPPGGSPVGLVSGGCLESDLAERADQVRRSGQSETVVYDMRSPDDLVWGLGLGCNGEIRVLLELLAPGTESPDYLAFIDDCWRRRRAGVVVTLFEVEGDTTAAVGDRIVFDGDVEVQGALTADTELVRAAGTAARSCLERRQSSVERLSVTSGRVEALVEYVAPAIRLLVFGAGLDAPAVARSAVELGWQVTVLDNRPAQLQSDRFGPPVETRLVEFDKLDTSGIGIDGTTPAVVMTHHFLHDVEILKFLMPSAAPYVGVLGPRQRRTNLLDELAGRDFRPDEQQLARFHGPVGIDIGSETPEEIALSMLAEIQAVLNRRTAGFLRERRDPLHDWPG